jgi:hypothetical protein
VRKGIAVYEAHCVAHGKMIPFFPVLEMMRGEKAIEYSQLAGERAVNDAGRREDRADRADGPGGAPRAERITEGGAPALLQRLARLYLGPDAVFPPETLRNQPGWITWIKPERFGGIGPWNPAET